MRIAIGIAALLMCAIPGTVSGEETLRLATTTSTYETGLLDLLLPPFEAKHRVKVHVISVGTGKAIKLGENGDVDVILVHAPKAEDAFVNNGFGLNRRDVMYNDFVVAGPKADPANVAGMEDARRALKKIYEKQCVFVSRGDDSGTHKKEKGLWSAAGLTPAGKWYMQVGQGMSAALRIADEKKGYVLVDRGTYLAHRDNIDLKVLVEGGAGLGNPYGVIPVSPSKHPHVKYQLSMQLVAWLTAPECQKRISEFRMDGEQLFYANAAGPVLSDAATNDGNYLRHGLREALQLIISMDEQFISIVFVSVTVSMMSTLLAALTGVPFGIMLVRKNFRCRGAIVTVVNTLMSLPTVVVGLLVYSFLSRGGPAGSLGWLFTKKAMILGQFILAFPIVAGLTIAAVRSLDKRIQPTIMSLGARPSQGITMFLREARFGILAAVVAGFGRVFAEVGVSMMLGANIAGSTRNITTAIALETSKGEFGLGIALGIVLLAVALFVNVMFGLFQKRAK